MTRVREPLFKQSRDALRNQQQSVEQSGRRSGRSQEWSLMQVREARGVLVSRSLRFWPARRKASLVGDLREEWCACRARSSTFVPKAR